MTGRSAIALGLFGVCLTGGCADLMQRSTIAPEWFQAKAIEVKGEGYPDLKDVPDSRGPTGGAPEWETQAAELRTARTAMEAKAAEAGAIPTEEEIRARAAQLRAELDGTEALEGEQP
jgi:hypothetical protein